MSKAALRGKFWAWGVLLLAVVVSGFGCAKEKPMRQVEAESFLLEKSPPSSMGSLWDPGNGRAYMFEDRRAGRIGDIVVVQIVEQHKS